MPKCLKFALGGCSDARFIFSKTVSDLMPMSEKMLTHLNSKESLSVPASAVLLMQSAAGGELGLFGERETQLLLQVASESAAVFLYSLPDNDRGLAVARQIAGILAECEEMKVRQLTVCAVGARASQMAIELFLAAPTLLRRLLLNGLATKEPLSGLRSAIDWLDLKLPLGLPLLRRREGGDFRSVLHAVTCPVFLFSAVTASEQLSKELSFARERIPSARVVKVGDLSDAELGALFAEILATPWKQPQRKKVASH